MKDVNRALVDIANIRNQIAAGSLFQGFGPFVILITGFVALTIAYYQSMFPAKYATDQILIFNWLVVGVACICLIGIECLLRSKRLHGGMADKMLLGIIEQFLPIGFAGVVITVIFYSFAKDSLWILPGLWQILISIGIFAALKSLPEKVRLAAAWYFIAGVVVLVLAAKGKAISPWMMGVPFGIGQLLMAVILHFADNKENKGI